MLEQFSCWCWQNGIQHQWAFFASSEEKAREVALRDCKRTTCFTADQKRGVHVCRGAGLNVRALIATIHWRRKADGEFIFILKLPWICRECGGSFPDKPGRKHCPWKKIFPEQHKPPKRKKQS